MGGGRLSKVARALGRPGAHGRDGGGANGSSSGGRLRLCRSGNQRVREDVWWWRRVESWDWSLELLSLEGGGGKAKERGGVV